MNGRPVLKSLDIGCERTEYHISPGRYTYAMKIPIPGTSCLP